MEEEVFDLEDIENTFFNTRPSSFSDSPNILGAGTYTREACVQHVLELAFCPVVSEIAFAVFSD